MCFGYFTKSFPDNRFDSVSLPDSYQDDQEVKMEFQPHINTHHGVAIWIPITASRLMLYSPLSAPYRSRRSSGFMLFETASSTECAAPLVADAFLPNVYLDISRTLDKKVEALTAYKDEIRAYPHPRSIQAFELIARRNGVDVGLEAAERFALIRVVYRLGASI